MQPVLVEALSSGQTSRCAPIIDSYSAPYFSGVVLKLLALRASTDGTKLLAKVFISGALTSRICDLFAGAAGTINEIVFRVGWERFATMPTQVSKALLWESMTRPFPMSAQFQAEFDNVEVSTGNILFELYATDLVPGSSLTGSIAFTIRIDLLTKESSSHVWDEQPRSHEVGNFTFLTWEAKFFSQSAVGETHVYYVQVEDGLASEVNPTQHANSFIRGPDNKYYLAGQDGRPAPSLLVVAGAEIPMRRDLLLDAGTFESGFLKGFVHSRATFPCGPLTLRQTGHGTGGGVDVEVSSEVAEQLGLTGRKIGELGVHVREYSPLVSTVYEYITALNGSDYDTTMAVATGRWEKFLSCSDDAVRMGLYGLELVQNIYDELKPKTSASMLGYMQGRACSETLACITNQRKKDGLSKETVLRALKKRNWLDAECPSLLDRVISAWRRLPFG